MYVITFVVFLKFFFFFRLISFRSRVLHNCARRLCFVLPCATIYNFFFFYQCHRHHPRNYCWRASACVFAVHAFSRENTCTEDTCGQRWYVTCLGSRSKNDLSSLESKVNTIYVFHLLSLGVTHYWIFYKLDSWLPEISRDIWRFSNISENIRSFPNITTVFWWKKYNSHFISCIYMLLC